jgi:inner membrane protein COX18
MLRSTSQNFFALPPAHRLSLYEQSLQRSIHPSPRRAFSATTSRKSDIYRTIVSVPATLLDAIHSTGLPWFATIPAAAILVRGVLIYYTCTKPAHLNRNKLSHLNPLIAARASSMSRHVGISRPTKDDGLFVKLRFILAHFLTHRKVLRRVKDQFALPHTWRTLVPTYLSLIVMAEAIRVRCGASRGLLDALLSPFSWWDSLKLGAQVVAWDPYSKEPNPIESHLAADVSSGSSVATTSTADVSSGSGVATTSAAEPVDAVSHVDLSGSGSDTPATEPVETSPHADLSGSSVDTSSAAEPVEALSHVDLSGFADLTLAVEGLPWCPNLTVADPMGILPSLLCFTIAIPAVVRLVCVGRTLAPPPLTNMSKAEADAAMAKYNGGAAERGKLRETHAQRCIGSFAFAVAFMLLMTKVPAGILLYIISNQMTALVQRSWLQFKYPTGKTIRPCPRPMRRKVRNSFGTVVNQ